MPAIPSTLSRVSHHAQRRHFFRFPQLPANARPETYHEKKILPYTRRQLYAVVSDVASYASFVPFCKHSRVLVPPKPAPTPMTPDALQMEAELTVAFLAFTERYTSRVTCVPYESVKAVATSATPLFKALETTWRFQPASGRSPRPSGAPRPLSRSRSPSGGAVSEDDVGPTLVSLELSFAFANPVHAAVSGAFFGKVSALMTTLFNAVADLSQKWTEWQCVDRILSLALRVSIIHRSQATSVTSSALSPSWPPLTYVSSPFLGDRPLHPPPRHRARLPPALPRGDPAHRARPKSCRLRLRPPPRPLFIRKDRKPPPPVSGPSSAASSPTTLTPPPRRKPPPSEWDETPSPSPNGAPRANTRDALLLGLLSSEAIVDSREYEILSAEEVEELKKASVAIITTIASSSLCREHTVLSSRVVALQRKHATEVKIRDAAHTLARLNTSSSSPTRISRQSKDALEASERKAETAQTELWRLSRRRSVLRSKQHAAPDADRMRSPLSSPPSAEAASKFDGAHLFAGHEDAVVPGRPSHGAAPRPSSSAGLKELEAKLAAVEARAQEQEALLVDARLAAASDLQTARAEAAEELAGARASRASDLAQAQQRASELEERVAQLEHELESSIRGREDASYLQERIRRLEHDLSGAESRADQVRTEAEAAAAAWAVERASWASERALFKQEQERRAELSETLEKERTLWEEEREELAVQAKEQIAEATEGLHDLVRHFEVPLFSRESRIGVLVDGLGRYLEKHNAAEFEQLRVAEAEKRDAMAQELEATKGEMQALQARSSGSAATWPYMEPRPSSPITFAKDAAGLVSILQPIWAVLPSPEARAARLSSAARPFRAGSGRTSPGGLRTGSPGGSPGPSVSISDMDVRALKSLYTPGSSGSGPGPSAGGSASRSASPIEPSDSAGVFSVEAFAQRVQSLISDDRALMERLIRFAHAHDMLKKNAERAQKLAQESNAALETYQRQVHTLEEHLVRANGWEDQVNRLAEEKLAAEQRAAQQAEKLRQFTDANAAFSARAQELSQEVTAAQEELRAARSVSEREQEQRLALLEEINLVQTENGNLRQLLRALGKL
ncbi:dehydrase and lipid transport-domain-containing protein [Russula earlei]|uniref:Dehydrase and lipid transport-domain-containing protein n=1 Tax=Russula earlei TaxID=71964 RepID=A0ACC0U578_9AGAM|nr:dehydrase and lipid transport-domain-containing protein [Russula earlei]